MNDINIYLIRHGETEVNILPDMIGQPADTKLTKNGEEQAAKLGKRFADTHFDKLYSSTYPRAVHTAGIFMEHLKSMPDGVGYSDSLVEYDPGDWKGSKRSAIYADQNKLNAINYLNMGFLFPNGESYHQVERRASKFIEDAIIYNKDVLELAKEKELNIAVFSHGQTIKAILHYVMGYDSSFLWKIRIGNTSVCHLVYNDKGFFLNGINDASHLTTP